MFLAGSKSTKETQEKCEICPKLTTKTLQKRHWRRSDVFIANFGQISQNVLGFFTNHIDM